MLRKTVIITDILKFFRSLFLKDPFHIILFVTDRCNFFCDHCLNKDFSKSTIVDIDLNSISKLSKSAGSLFYLSITGGEPFIRNDILEICKFFYQYSDTKRFSIHTNGSFPNKIFECVETLLKECPNIHLKICVSLDALNDDNDLIHGYPGSFNKTIETIFLLKKIDSSRLSISVNSVLTNSTMKTITETQNYILNDLKVNAAISFFRSSSIKTNSIDKELIDIYRLSTQTLTSFKNRKNYLLKHSFLKKVRFDFIKKILSNKIIRMKCFAGNKTFVIKPSGKVFGCEVTKTELGDLLDTDYNFKQLIKSSEFKKKLSSLESKNCICTWECIILTNLFYNPLKYPYLLKEYISFLCKRQINNWYKKINFSENEKIKSE